MISAQIFFSSVILTFIQYVPRGGELYKSFENDIGNTIASIIVLILTGFLLPAGFAKLSKEIGISYEFLGYWFSIPFIFSPYLIAFGIYCWSKKYDLNFNMFLRSLPIVGQVHKLISFNIAAFILGGLILIFGSLFIDILFGTQFLKLSMDLMFKWGEAGF